MGRLACAIAFRLQTGGEGAGTAREAFFEATAGGPLRTVKPFTPEVRANIDNELVDAQLPASRLALSAAKLSSWLMLCTYDRLNLLIPPSHGRGAGNAGQRLGGFYP